MAPGKGFQHLQPACVGISIPSDGVLLHEWYSNYMNSLGHGSLLCSKVSTQCAETLPEEIPFSFYANDSNIVLSDGRHRPAARPLIFQGQFSMTTLEVGEDRDPSVASVSVSQNFTRTLVWTFGGLLHAPSMFGVVCSGVGGELGETVASFEHHLGVYPTKSSNL